MKSQKLFKKVLVCGMFLFSLFFFMTSYANAAWFKCRITQITTRANGDSVVIFSPGTGEINFTENPRGMVYNADEGDDKILAMILTAISFGYEVNIEMASTPTFTPAQDITAIGMITQ